MYVDECTRRIWPESERDSEKMNNVKVFQKVNIDALCLHYLLGPFHGAIAVSRVVVVVVVVVIVVVGVVVDIDAQAARDSTASDIW